MLNSLKHKLTYQGRLSQRTMAEFKAFDKVHFEQDQVHLGDGQQPDDDPGESGQGRQQLGGKDGGDEEVAANNVEVGSVEDGGIVKGKSDEGGDVGQNSGNGIQNNEVENLHGDDVCEEDVKDTSNGFGGELEDEKELLTDNGVSGKAGHMLLRGQSVDIEDASETTSLLSSGSREIHDTNESSGLLANRNSEQSLDMHVSDQSADELPFTGNEDTKKAEDIVADEKDNAFEVLFEDVKYSKACLDEGAESASNCSSDVYQDFQQHPEEKCCSKCQEFQPKCGGDKSLETIPLSVSENSRCDVHKCEKVPNSERQKDSHKEGSNNKEHAETTVMDQNRASTHSTKVNGIDVNSGDCEKIPLNGIREQLPAATEILETQIIYGKEEENSKIRSELREVKERLSELEDKFHGAMETIAEKNASIKYLQDEMDQKEEASKEMYLKMYEKGRKSAVFERQDQLEKLAVQDPESVSPAELLAKLEATQKELIRWQALKRQETYDEADKAESPAEAKLNFLKDSMFHYLTDKEMEGQHLRAMVGILGFTEVQLRKIKTANEKQKSRKSSATK